MKGNRFKMALLAVLAMLTMAVVQPGQLMAKAQVESLAPKTAEVLYDSEGNYLPTIFSDEYVYSISIYSISDTDYKNPIAENVGMRYTFEGPGEYVLQYYLVHTQTGECSYEYTRFKLIDKEAPILSLNGAYNDWYALGEKVEIIDVVIYDKVDAQLAEFSYKVILNGSDVTAQVSNGVITVADGEYEIVYTAIDNSGNEGSLSVFFTVGDNWKTPEDIESDPSQSGSCASTIGSLPLMAVGLAALATVLTKRRGE